MSSIKTLDTVNKGACLHYVNKRAYLHYINKRRVYIVSKYVRISSYFRAYIYHPPYIYHPVYIYTPYIYTPIYPYRDYNEGPTMYYCGVVRFYVHGSARESDSFRKHLTITYTYHSYSLAHNTTDTCSTA